MTESQQLLFSETVALSCAWRMSPLGDESQGLRWFGDYFSQELSGYNPEVIVSFKSDKGDVASPAPLKQWLQAFDHSILNESLAGVGNANGALSAELVAGAFFEHVKTEMKACGLDLGALTLRVTATLSVKVAASGLKHVQSFRLQSIAGHESNILPIDWLVKAEFSGALDGRSGSLLEIGEWEEFLLRLQSELVVQPIDVYLGVPAESILEGLFVKIRQSFPAITSLERRDALSGHTEVFTG